MVTAPGERAYFRGAIRVSVRSTAPAAPNRAIHSWQISSTSRRCVFHEGDPNGNVSPMPKRGPLLSRAEVIAQLRRFDAAVDAPLKLLELPNALRLAVQRHFGSMDAARAAARIEKIDLSRRWSRAAIVGEICTLHERGVRLTETSLKAEHQGLLAAIGRFFSGIGEARRAAKVPEPAPLGGKRQRWDEARVIAEIDELSRSGESLAGSRAPVSLVKAGMRYFGSWKDAVEAAGYRYNEVRLTREAYTEDELIGILREMANSQPELALTALHEQSFTPAIYRIFGSVEAALERARLRDWPNRTREAAMSRDEVIAAIRKREREGLSTSWKAVHSGDHHLWYSGVLCFGDWRLACEDAGVDLADHNRRWTRESVIEGLQERARSGLSLVHADIRREDSGLHAATLVHFRSYAAAVRAAAIRP
jgi:hypothetical protein